ncbi:MAG: general secretion pathway protein E [Parcubacteria group bacterium Gr01-1014_46]|nr:MAG: general secretion pathway protein E [Parcubacteria group bacterium Gr01-1014_46]
MTTTEEKLSKLEGEMLRGKDISIVNLVDCLIEKAHKSSVSDIHIDPGANKVRVRFRVDGVLQESISFPKSIHNEIISRIKVLSKLRTDEHQATQDGRFRYIFYDSSDFVDLRVSIVPTYHGENVVMRLLSDKAENFNLENLGFSKSDRKKIMDAIRKPSGMILSTGPTGSGKTTTLYTLIKILNSPEVSIVTIEDPIEYAINGVEQIQVNTRSGLTFANGLRSILRQDPNIIMVGEIRDNETASIAVNTALTGHLLLSTLHTNDAATTLPRLLDMGIEEYLVASTVSIAIGQRLVRKICSNCKKKWTIPDSLKESLSGTPFEKLLNKKQWFYEGMGCEQCDGNGYKGRISINEVLVADETIKEAILRKAPASEIKKIAIARGMTTMIEDGFHKVESGLTTLEEVLRVIQE